MCSCPTFKAASGAQAQPSPHGESKMVRAFLLKPHVAGMVVCQFHDQRARGFRKRRRDLLDQLFLTLNIDGRKELVLVDRLKKLLVFRFALVFGI